MPKNSKFPITYRTDGTIENDLVDSSDDEDMHMRNSGKGPCASLPTTFSREPKPIGEFYIDELKYIPDKDEPDQLQPSLFMPVIGLSSLPNSQPESNNTSNVASALSHDEMLKAMIK